MLGKPELIPALGLDFGREVGYRLFGQAVKQSQG